MQIVPAPYLKIMAKFFLIAGSLLLALGVGIGAFGAHVVQETLSADRYDVYQTAVTYHFYHALGLLIIGAVMNYIQESVLLSWSGWCLVAGILIFPGSLYLLVLTGKGWLGAVTPIGGLAFIVGWILFAIAVYKNSGV